MITIKQIFKVGLLVVALSTLLSIPVAASVTVSDDGVLTIEEATIAKHNRLIYTQDSGKCVANGCWPYNPYIPCRSTTPGCHTIGGWAVTMSQRRYLDCIVADSTPVGTDYIDGTYKVVDSTVQAIDYKSIENITVEPRWFGITGEDAVKNGVDEIVFEGDPGGHSSYYCKACGSYDPLITESMRIKFGTHSIKWEVENNVYPTRGLRADPKARAVAIFNSRSYIGLKAEIPTTINGGIYSGSPALSSVDITVIKGAIEDLDQGCASVFTIGDDSEAQVTTLL